MNTDNRLMSGCTMTSELTSLVETFGYGWSDLRWFTVNAMKSAFLGFDERLGAVVDVLSSDHGRVALHGPAVCVEGPVRLRLDLDGGELYQREDDRPEVVAERIKVYLKDTVPVVEYFRKHGILREVDGTQGIDAVAADIERQLEVAVW